MSPRHRCGNILTPEQPTAAGETTHAVYKDPTSSCAYILRNPHTGVPMDSVCAAYTPERLKRKREYSELGPDDDEEITGVIMCDTCARRKMRRRAPWTLPRQRRQSVRRGHGSRGAGDKSGGVSCRPSDLDELKYDDDAAFLSTTMSSLDQAIDPVCDLLIELQQVSVPRRTQEEVAAKFKQQQKQLAVLLLRLKNGNDGSEPGIV